MHIKQKITGLSGLFSRLNEIKMYLDHVVNGRVPYNSQIINNLQDVLNLLPNLNVELLVKSLITKSNDIHLVIYISSLVRSVIALHALLNNKIKYRDVEDVLDRGAGVDAFSSSSPLDANKKEVKDGVAPADGSNDPDSAK